MTTPRTDNLRAALDRPESKLARAIGKAHFGGTGYYFDAEGWAFLLGAVEAARAALASPSPEPLGNACDDERCIRIGGHFPGSDHTDGVTSWPAASPSPEPLRDMQCGCDDPDNPPHYESDHRAALASPSPEPLACDNKETPDYWMERHRMYAGLRENPDAKALIDGWHLTDGAIDAMNAALGKTFAIYDDPEAGTDLDGDSVSVMDALMGNGYVVASWSALRAALASPSPEPLDELRALSDAATPGPWYVEGPEFGGLWVCAEHGDRQVSGAVHPSRSEQPYAVLAGLGRADSDLIVAAVNYVRARLSEDS